MILDSGMVQRYAEMGALASLNSYIRYDVKFGSILTDSWFTSAENMRFIEKKGRVFIFEINDNRLAAANEQEREKGRFTRIDRMEISDEGPLPVF
jgi:hypothetical protein